MSRVECRPDEEEAALRFRLAGVTVPSDRAAGPFANAARLLAMMHWLRSHRDGTHEPAGVFDPRMGLSGTGPATMDPDMATARP